MSIKSEIKRLKFSNLPDKAQIIDTKEDNNANVMMEIVLVLLVLLASVIKIRRKHEENGQVSLEIRKKDNTFIFIYLPVIQSFTHLKHYTTHKLQLFMP